MPDLNAERLRQVLEGLELIDVDEAMHLPPAVLRKIAEEITKAAKLGADLYQAIPR